MVYARDRHVCTPSASTRARTSDTGDQNSVPLRARYSRPIGLSFSEVGATAPPPPLPLPPCDVRVPLRARSPGRRRGEGEPPMLMTVPGTSASSSSLNSCRGAALEHGDLVQQARC